MIVFKSSEFSYISYVNTITHKPNACYLAFVSRRAFTLHDFYAFPFPTFFSYVCHNSGLGTSQSESRLEDAFSDEENGSGYDGSPTHQSYRPHSFSGYISPGGDLSDEDICGGISTSSGPPGFDYISSGNGSQPSTPHQQQCARSRSGSCASRRSQYR